MRFCRRLILSVASVCLGVFVVIGFASPVAAQTQPSRPIKIPPVAPDVAVRPFFLLNAQHFTASDTFEAVFGSATQPFYGGGAQITLSNGFFVEGALSWFSKTGSRAFVLDSEASPLDIPLKVTIMPIEVTGGYRFGADFSNRVTPYIGGGYTSYKYSESSDFDAAGEDASLHGNGYLVVGGAEFRVAKWAVVSADVQYTHVGGVIGSGGLSQELGEDDLGGISARFRVIIGR